MKGHHSKVETLAAEGKLHWKWGQLRLANSRLHSAYCAEMASRDGKQRWQAYLPQTLFILHLSLSFSLPMHLLPLSLSLNHTKSTIIPFLSLKPDEPYLSLAPSLSL
ncbi:hypothetical protein AMTRI_Chr01g105410 [Amborella trichopoda]